VTVQPAGANAVTVSVDFGNGNGMEQRRLTRINEEFGLSVARRNEADLPQ
jgi:hypothetical protein